MQKNYKFLSFKSDFKTLSQLPNFINLFIVRCAKVMRKRYLLNLVVLLMFIYVFNFWTTVENGHFQKTKYKAKTKGDFLLSEMEMVNFTTMNWLVLTDIEFINAWAKKMMRGGVISPTQMTRNMKATFDKIGVSNRVTDLTILVIEHDESENQKPEYLQAKLVHYKRVLKQNCRIRNFCRYLTIQRQRRLIFHINSFKVGYVDVMNYKDITVEKWFVMNLGFLYAIQNGALNIMESYSDPNLINKLSLGTLFNAISIETQTGTDETDNISYEGIYKGENGKYSYVCTKNPNFIQVIFHSSLPKHNTSNNKDSATAIFYDFKWFEHKLLIKNRQNFGFNIVYKRLAFWMLLRLPPTNERFSLLRPSRVAGKEVVYHHPMEQGEEDSTNFLNLAIKLRYRFIIENDIFVHDEAKILNWTDESKGVIINNLAIRLSNRWDRIVDRCIVPSNSIDSYCIIQEFLNNNPYSSTYKNTNASTNGLRNALENDFSRLLSAWIMDVNRASLKANSIIKNNIRGRKLLNSFSNPRHHMVDDQNLKEFCKPFQHVQLGIDSFVKERFFVTRPPNSNEKICSLKQHILNEATNYAKGNDVEQGGTRNFMINQFHKLSRIIFLVVFNYPYYDIIPTISKLYGDVFLESNTFYCINEEMARVERVKEREEVFRHRNFIRIEGDNRGFYTYDCLIKLYAIIKFRRTFKDNDRNKNGDDMDPIGVLYTNDDVLINIKRLAKFRFDLPALTLPSLQKRKFSEPHFLSPNISLKNIADLSFILNPNNIDTANFRNEKHFFDIRLIQQGSRILKSLVDLKMARDILLLKTNKGTSNDINTRAYDESSYLYPNIPPNTILTELATCYENLLNLTGGPGRIFYDPADFFYVPTWLMKPLTTVLSVFRHHNVMLEIPIVTAINCIIHPLNFKRLFNETPIRSRSVSFSTNETEPAIITYFRPNHYWGTKRKNVLHIASKLSNNVYVHPFKLRLFQVAHSAEKTSEDKKGNKTNGSTDYLCQFLKDID